MGKVFKPAMEVWPPLSSCPRSSLPAIVLAWLAARPAHLMPPRPPGQGGTPPLPLEARLDAVAAVILDGLSYRRAGRMAASARPRSATAWTCCSARSARSARWDSAGPTAPSSPPWTNSASVWGRWPQAADRRWGAEWDGAQNIGRDDRMCAYGAPRIRRSRSFSSLTTSSIHVTRRFSGPASALCGACCYLLQTALCLADLMAGEGRGARTSSPGTGNEPFAVERRRHESPADPVEEQECRRSDQGGNERRLDDVQRDKHRQSDRRKARQ